MSNGRLIFKDCIIVPINDTSLKSGSWGSVECSRKHSLYWSFSDSIQSTILTQSFIWFFGRSKSSMSSDEDPNISLSRVI